MSFKKLLIRIISLAVAAYSLSTFAASRDYPEITEDGLHLLKDSKLAIVYVEPGADFAAYNRVMLISPEVAFKKNWERNLRSGSASKISRVNTKKIKSDLAREFETIFTETLTNGGYEVVEEAAEDVLLVRPSIVNLDITAPEQAGAGRTSNFTRSAGEMTLYVELYDSETGDLIAKALDRRIDNPNNHGVYTWTTTSSNMSAANKILRGWATILLNALDEARNSPVVPLPESN